MREGRPRHEDEGGNEHHGLEGPDHLLDREAPLLEAPRRPGEEEAGIGVDPLHGQDEEKDEAELRAEPPGVAEPPPEGQGQAPAEAEGEEEKGVLEREESDEPARGDPPLAAAHLDLGREGEGEPEEEEGPVGKAEGEDDGPVYRWRPERICFTLTASGAFGASRRNCWKSATALSGCFDW